MPEIIYNKIKDNLRFQQIYTQLNNLLDNNSQCLVAYTDLVNQDSIYQELHQFMKDTLDLKLFKIWQCFNIDIDFDEDQDKAEWTTVKNFIDTCKQDQDLDIKMYAYYMELANTADHESKIWIDNVDQSIIIWEQNKDRVFDPRLYTKYYWDKHEQFAFYLKEKTNKDIEQAFFEFEKIDRELKEFLFSKHNSKYFRDIINHKTLYTITLFWGSVNDVSLQNPDKTVKVLQMLDEKIVNLDYKYAGFNMHLMEWLWIVFKYWVDKNDKEKCLGVWSAILSVLNNATKDKPYMIKALNHHNFNYTSRFLTFVSNLYEVETKLMNAKRSFILEANWTEAEKKVITGDPEATIAIWRERPTTAKNYQKNMIMPLRNKFRTA